MPSYHLYKTDFCHLCDKAEDIIKNVIPQIEVCNVEIIDDQRLMDLYGLRIPVLRNVSTSEELDWPFTLTDVNNFIANKKAS